MSTPPSDPRLYWYKSSYSSDTANCLEIAVLPATILVRDSKDPDGSTLSYTTASWRDFISGIRGGDFDASA